MGAIESSMMLSQECTPLLPSPSRTLFCPIPSDLATCWECLCPGLSPLPRVTLSLCLSRMPVTSHWLCAACPSPATNLGVVIEP